MEKNKKKEELQKEVEESVKELNCDAPWSNIDADKAMPKSCPDC